MARSEAFGEILSFRDQANILYKGMETYGIRLVALAAFCKVSIEDIGGSVSTEDLESINKIKGIFEQCDPGLVSIVVNKEFEEAFAGAEVVSTVENYLKTELEVVRERRRKAVNDMNA